LHAWRWFRNRQGFAIIAVSVSAQSFSIYLICDEALLQAGRCKRLWRWLEPYTAPMLPRLDAPACPVSGKVYAFMELAAWRAKVI